MLMDLLPEVLNWRIVMIGVLIIVADTVIVFWIVHKAMRRLGGIRRTIARLFGRAID